MNFLHFFLVFSACMAILPAANDGEDGKIQWNKVYQAVRNLVKQEMAQENWYRRQFLEPRKQGCRPGP